ncbi:MAG: hypothetical protein L6Q94_16720, partial [Calditrichia bacterium]|nr:hypothetical protein [Calditrichia bacterium]
MAMAPPGLITIVHLNPYLRELIENLQKIQRFFCGEIGPAGCGFVNAVFAGRLRNCFKSFPAIRIPVNLSKKSPQRPLDLKKGVFTLSFFRYCENTCPEQK